MINHSTGLLRIDLGAIQDNWLSVRNKLVGNALCAAVVKADAYSVGVDYVASALYEVGCRHFYCATLNEAIDVRAQLNADAVIYILGGVRLGSEAQVVASGLIPVLYSLVDIKRWSDFCESNSQAFPCAIKMDTGMSRLGLSESEFQTFLAQVDEMPYLTPVLFMSHLACADETDHPLNLRQLTLFTESSKQIKAVFPNTLLSLANSSGVFLGGEYHFDMVRIGAALYGINPQPKQSNPLKQIISLRLPILQIKIADHALLVGYGAEGAVNAGARLAVVAGGYADGIHRTLGRAPCGVINQVRVSAVGRISMDSCVFDISSVAEELPEYIEVINSEITLDTLMERTKSLGYEVLTSLGRRYRREYVRKGMLNDC